MYAVSRNIEDLDKITPMMPSAIDPNDEVVRMGPTIVSSEYEQVASTPLPDYC